MRSLSVGSESWIAAFGNVKRRCCLDSRSRLYLQYHISRHANLSDCMTYTCYNTMITKVIVSVLGVWIQENALRSDGMACIIANGCLPEFNALR